MKIKPIFTVITVGVVLSGCARYEYSCPPNTKKEPRTWSEWWNGDQPKYKCRHEDGSWIAPYKRRITYSG